MGNWREHGFAGRTLGRMVHQGNYVGFEPQVELFKILTANLLVNQLTNARSMNIALGDQEGILQLPGSCPTKWCN